MDWYRVYEINWFFGMADCFDSRMVTLEIRSIFRKLRHYLFKLDSSFIRKWRLEGDLGFLRRFSSNQRVAKKCLNDWISNISNAWKDAAVNVIKLVSRRCVFELTLYGVNDHRERKFWIVKFFCVVKLYIILYWIEFNNYFTKFTYRIIHQRLNKITCVEIIQ